MFGRNSTTEAPESFSELGGEGRTAAISILPGVPLPAGLVASLTPEPVVPEPVAPEPFVPEPALAPPVAEVATQPDPEPVEHPLPEPEAVAAPALSELPPPPPSAAPVASVPPPPAYAPVTDSAPELPAPPLEAESTAAVLPDVPLPPAFVPAAIADEDPLFHSLPTRDLAAMPAPVVPSPPAPSTAVMVGEDAPARRSFFGALRRRPAAPAPVHDEVPVPVSALGRSADPVAPAVPVQPVPVGVGAVAADAPAPPPYVPASAAPAGALTPPPYVAPEPHVPAPPPYAPPAEASVPAFAHLSPAQQVTFPAAMEAANAQAQAARAVGLVYADGSHTELAGPESEALQHVANVLAGEPEAAPNE